MCLLPRGRASSKQSSLLPIEIVATASSKAYGKQGFARLCKALKGSARLLTALFEGIVKAYGVIRPWNCPYN
jgi:hypothetical protein